MPKNKIHLNLKQADLFEEPYKVDSWLAIKLLNPVFENKDKNIALSTMYS